MMMLVWPIQLSWSDWALAAHLAATWAMVGVIWCVQLVLYPLFAEAGPEAFRAYHAAHVRRITWVVAPLMAAEAAMAIALMFSPRVPRGLAVAGLALLVIIWASTAWLQVPRHAELSGGFAYPAWRRLVRSNWVRTLAWTSRGVLALAMAFA